MLGVRMNVEDTASEQKNTDTSVKINHERTGLISVPVMVNGKVAGYVIAQLVYTVDTEAKKQLSVPLGLFVNDEVFRVFFGSYSDTREIEKVEFDDVKRQIIDGVNQRFPEPVIKDILVERFNFVSAEQVRAQNRRH